VSAEDNIRHDNEASYYSIYTESIMQLALSLELRTVEMLEVSVDGKLHCKNPGKLRQI
jgi:hypothetical protein